MDKFVPTQPAEVVHGLPPEGDLTSVTVSQEYPDTCAIRSQEIILRDFGIDVSQDQLRQEAMAHGWYTPGGGTPAADVGKLLELHGVGVTRYDNANVYNLVSDLSAGKRIIVDVDSGELWNPGEGEKMEDSVLGDRPDHALIVAGVDTTNPDDVKVILTDPGTGHVAKEYPLAQFMDAWKDSGCEMVCTNAPAPVTASGMAHFDYDTRHLPIGDVPYSDWVEEHGDLMSPASYVSADLDGDGLIDLAQMDMDRDGVADLAVVDMNRDGMADRLTLDLTGNGMADVMVDRIAGTDGFQLVTDLAGDGIADAAGVDLDGDGVLDCGTMLS